jgi:ADP-heptose:LPS heptosyltransferase
MGRQRRLAADRLHQLLKRTQQRILAADYEELRRRPRWLELDASPDREVQTFDVRPDASSIRSVLVFKPDEIGDAVYGLPAIAELRKHIPRARFHLVCRGLTLPLYERAELFDEITTYEPGSRFGPFRRRLNASLRRLSLDEFDLGVFLRTYPATFREFLAVPCRQRVHPLDPRLRSSSVYRPYVGVWGERREHQGLQLLQIVAGVTGREYALADSVLPRLSWTADDRAALERVLGSSATAPFVVLHPFAKDETRRYPSEYWQEVAEGLVTALQVPLVVIGSRDDPSLADMPSLVQTQGRLELMQTAFLISKAFAFIGNLSGPAHLAAALGTPTFTLMSGHSLPAEWAPLGVSKVVRAEVPCAPCHQQTCPVYGLACLRELTPERVLPEIIDFLRARGAGGSKAPAGATSVPR